MVRSMPRKGDESYAPFQQSNMTTHLAMSMNVSDMSVVDVFLWDSKTTLQNDKKSVQ